MTLAKLRELVSKWDREIGETDPVGTAKYQYILDGLEHHGNQEWKTYLPAAGTQHSTYYLDRLAAWVGNGTDEDEQKTLLEYAEYISFFSQDDFAALYRTAFNREVLRWIAESIGTNLVSDGPSGMSERVMTEAHSHTWYCPVTDSMKINEFYKINNIQGASHRPAFATFPDLGPTKSKALAYMEKVGRHKKVLKRIVLLEDVVGSGQQSRPVLQWVADNIPFPVLFVPLIICPSGIDTLEDEFGRLANITIRPVTSLVADDLLGSRRIQGNGWPIAERVEGLARKYNDNGRLRKPPFGFSDTGCSIVTYSNCPNSSLSMIHERRRKWSPLFPRVSRD